MPTAAVIASHFLCQPIRPAWSHSAFLAQRGLLRASHSYSPAHDLLGPAQVTSGPVSDTLTFLWKLFERSPDLGQRAKVIRQIGRSAGSIPLLEELCSLRLSEDETLALIETLAHHPDPRQLLLLKGLYRRFWSQPRFQQEVMLAAGHTRSGQGLIFLQEIYASAWHRPEYRQTVIRALGLHGQAEAVAMLVNISKQYPQDFKIQRAIIRALGYSSCATSAHVLKEMLALFPHAHMRQLIWRALAATASDTAVEVLRNCLRQSSDEQERQILKAALRHAYRDDSQT